jgi:lysophospholipase L1-like esterase
LRGITTYARFCWTFLAIYEAGHPSNALQITRGIIEAFASEATQRGQIPIVTLVPYCEDFNYRSAKGTFPYEPLARLISQSSSIRLIDFGSAILERIATPESLYIGCGRHFNEAGYSLLADIAREYLAEDRDILRLLSISHH